MALGVLPKIGITRYNGYVFPSGETIETTAYSVKCLYDSARRVVWACEFTITLRWTLASTSTTDAEVQEMVAKLTAPAGKLAFEGRGFATPGVNVGKVKDVDWGPRPSEVTLKCVGAGRATEATWTVQFTLPTCDDAVYTGVREFTFSLDYDRDHAGYTTRTYNATLKIAQTRKDARDRTLTESADEYLDKVIPALLPGFNREGVRHSLSEDKCMLRVTVVDSQMPPHIPPFGLVKASVEHSYSSQPGSYGIKWNGQFSASYEIARRDGTIVAAVADFFALMRDRLETGGPMRTTRGGPATIVPIVYSAVEPDVYGRTQVRLSCTYAVSGVKFSQILQRGGLWRPWSTDWKGWSASIPNVLSPRGHARLTFKANEDKLVDLCAPVEPLVPTAGQAPAFPVPADKKIDIDKALLAAFPLPKAADSWLAYRCHVTIHTETGRIVGSSLPSVPLPTARAGAPDWDVYAGQMPSAVGPSSAFPPLAGLIESPTGQSAGRAGETFVQQRTRPNLYVTLHGSALRYGFEIPMPELVAVNGAKPVLVGTPTFTHAVAAEALLAPIFAANWRLTYLFTDEGRIPSRIPVPATHGLA